jgi:uncharacterized protein
MDVDRTELQRLLDLQAEDTELRGLRHRRESLPEAEQLGEVRAQLDELESDLAIARKQHEEASREQSRLEGEIEILSQKIDREEKRLFAGSVSSPKELSSLQAEVEMLKRNRSSLEDVLLEVMVQVEGAGETVDSLTREHSEASERESELAETVARSTGEIDAALGEHSGRRAGVAAAIDANLLAMYEKLRDAKGGVGAAALVGDMCQGCHTKLPAKEVERLRAESGVQRCDNCRRILVVT